MAKPRKPSIPAVVRAAEAYGRNLLGRSFLVVGVGKDGDVEAVELHFEKGNFQHLTGVRTRASGITADEFYDRCIEGRLSEADIDPDEKGYVALKLRAARSIFAPGLPVAAFGKGNSSHLLLSADEVVGNKVGVLGLRRVGGGGHVPMTLLDANIRDEATDRHDVVAVFSRLRGETSYGSPVFTRDTAMGKPVDWEKVRHALPGRFNDLELPDQPPREI